MSRVSRVSLVSPSGRSSRPVTRLAYRAHPTCLSHLSYLTVAVRRARGVLLRLVRRRPAAIVIGAALVAPAVWLELASGYDAWWVDGLALVLGATGVALIWAGVTAEVRVEAECAWRSV